MLDLKMEDFDLLLDGFQYAGRFSHLLGRPENRREAS